MLPKIIKPCGTNNQTMCPFTLENAKFKAVTYIADFCKVT